MHGWLRLDQSKSHFSQKSQSHRLVPPRSFVFICSPTRSGLHCICMCQVPTSHCSGDNHASLQASLCFSRPPIIVITQQRSTHARSLVPPARGSGTGGARRRTPKPLCLFCPTVTAVMTEYAVIVDVNLIGREGRTQNRAAFSFSLSPAFVYW